MRLLPLGSEGVGFTDCLGPEKVRLLSCIDAACKHFIFMSRGEGKSSQVHGGLSAIIQEAQQSEGRLVGSRG